MQHRPRHHAGGLGVGTGLVVHVLAAEQLSREVGPQGIAEETQPRRCHPATQEEEVQALQGKAKQGP